VNDGNGRIVVGIRVDWEIIQGEGTLYNETTVTGSDGKTSNIIFPQKVGEIRIKATVFGSEESVVFTITVLERSS